MSDFRSVCLAIAGVCLSAHAAAAQDFEFKSSGQEASLIELFSSEGCSSCPPAEA